MDRTRVFATLVATIDVDPVTQALGLHGPDSPGGARCRAGDSERVCAALCAYLLVGVAFGGLFAALDALAPGSVGGARSGQDALGIDEAVYFSFVTLATLGDGDLVPATGAARALSILEAVFAQLYLAVLVARLVSLYGRER